MKAHSNNLETAPVSSSVSIASYENNVGYIEVFICRVRGPGMSKLMLLQLFFRSQEKIGSKMQNMKWNSYVKFVLILSGSRGQAAGRWVWWVGDDPSRIFG